MKYLFHRDESVYDAATKEFTFTTSENLHNPTHLRLEDVTYRASTQSDHLYPQTIYLRSNALTSMLRVNHTVEVRSDGSNRRSNIIAVLNQYTTGRYELRGRYRFTIDPHRTNKVFDFTFTDGQTALGDFTGSGTGVNAEFQITCEIK